MKHVGRTVSFKLAIAGTLLVLSACQRASVATVEASADAPADTSIQELMEAMVDPAADRVWEAVSSTITAQGEDKKQPQTDEEWREVRNAVILVREATHLLAMPGRPIVPAGGKILDEGHDGVLSTADAQKNLEAQFAAFSQLARALRDVTTRLLKAVDARDAEQVFEIGAEMDGVCESCHMTFWYPGQPAYTWDKK